MCLCMCAFCVQLYAYVREMDKSGEEALLKNQQRSILVTASPSSSSFSVACLLSCWKYLVKRPDMNSFYAEMTLLMPTICYRQLAARRASAATQRGNAAAVRELQTSTVRHTQYWRISLFFFFHSSKVIYSAFIAVNRAFVSPFLPNTDSERHDRSRGETEESEQRCCFRSTTFITFILEAVEKHKSDANLMSLYCKSLQWVVDYFMLWTLPLDMFNHCYTQTGKGGRGNTREIWHIFDCMGNWVCTLHYTYTHIDFYIELLWHAPIKTTFSLCSNKSCDLLLLDMIGLCTRTQT